MKLEVGFRIIVEEPPPGATFAVQRGRYDLLPAARVTKSKLVFQFPLTVADIDADPPRLTGEYAQGPARMRFVYVNSGTMAGQNGSCWTRRAKVPLYAITSALLREAIANGSVLEAVISGRSKDGGPACATVPLLRAWTES